jgi:hypothetical protein
MHRRFMGLCLALLLGLALGFGAANDARAAPLSGNAGAAITHQSPVLPVLVWRDCQRIAPCRGCRPVYRCRSCTYQRQCPRRGPCAWADVCVWGPYLPVAPRGVPIITTR